jgi:hypothetical protein
MTYAPCTFDPTDDGISWHCAGANQPTTKPEAKRIAAIRLLWRVSPHQTRLPSDERPVPRVHNHRAKIAPYRVGNRAYFSTGPISKEEGPAALLCRFERDESSPQAPKRRKGPPVRRSYALLNPRTQTLTRLLKHFWKHEW